MTPNFLPPKAAGKLQALEDRTVDAQDVVTATTRRISELSNALGTAPAETAGNLEHEISRLRAKLIEQQQKFQARMHTLTQVRQWLAGTPQSVELRMVPARRTSAGNVAQSVARLREQIASLRNERSKVQLASPTNDEIKASATEFVKRMAARGTPRMVAEHDRFDLTWSHDTFGQTKPDAASILAWFDPDTVTKRIHAQIDAIPRGDFALSVAEKAERLATIAVNLAALEHEEEALIEWSEEDGPVIARRSDASPMAILGLTVATAESVAA